MDVQCERTCVDPGDATWSASSKHRDPRVALPNSSTVAFWLPTGAPHGCQPLADGFPGYQAPDLDALHPGFQQVPNVCPPDSMLLDPGLLQVQKLDAHFDNSMLLAPSLQQVQNTRFGAMFPGPGTISSFQLVPKRDAAVLDHHSVQLGPTASQSATLIAGFHELEPQTGNSDAPSTKFDIIWAGARACHRCADKRIKVRQ